MFTLYGAAYMTVSFILVRSLQALGLLDIGPFRMAECVLGYYVAGLVLWVVCVRFLDPYFDGALVQYASSVRKAMQYGVFRGIEVSTALLWLLLSGASLLLGYSEGLIYVYGAICILTCIHAVLMPRAPIPAPPLPTPMPVDPLTPLAPSPAPSPTTPPGADVLETSFVWEARRDPVWRQSETYEVTSLIDLTEWREKHAEPRLVGREDAVRRWGVKYARGGIGATVATLGVRLRQVSSERSLTPLQEAVLALSFAQSAIEYMDDATSAGQAEYPKYPVETTYDRNGDCEDKAILAAALLEYLGYDAVLFSLPGHVALGLALEPGLPGAVWFEHAGRAYYFCEATSNGAWIGELPSGVPQSLEVIPV